MVEILLHSFSRTISENVVDHGGAAAEMLLSPGSYRLHLYDDPPAHNPAIYTGPAFKSPLSVKLQKLISSRANATVPEPKKDRWQLIGGYEFTVTEPTVYRLCHAAGSKGNCDLFQVTED